MQRREISIDGLSTRYYDSGEGPSLIFVHGAGGTARLWHRQLGPLSARFRVLAPDLPGFGGSERSPDIASVRGYAAFLARFMDALGVGSASVVGHSMGGWAGCWFALDFPERLERLMLISPAGLYLPDNPPMPLSGLVEELRRAYSAVPFDANGTRPNEELMKGVETLLAIDKTGGLVPDLDGRLPGISAETLIIWGSDDRVIPASYGAGFNRLIHRSRLALLDGAGHQPFAERPEEVNRLLLDFL